MKDQNLFLFNQLSTTTSALHKKLDRTLGALHGLGISEFRVLNQLNQIPNNTATRIELANCIGLTASGITRLLNPMEKIGLVEKQANKRDARTSLVKLSRSGQKLFLDALEGADQIMSDSLKEITTAERKTLLSIIQKIS